jgi:hypothetical protein
MKSVRTLSRTILVVAEISLVTVIPAKLKKAMLKMVPVKITKQGAITSFMSYSAKIEVFDTQLTSELD